MLCKDWICIGFCYLLQQNTPSIELQNIWLSRVVVQKVFCNSLAVSSKRTKSKPNLFAKPNTITFSKINLFYFQIHFRGVVVITTAQLHSTKPEPRFCWGSNPACGVSEIGDGNDLWQWSRFEIKLNAFRRATIPQKQFIIIVTMITRT